MALQQRVIGILTRPADEWRVIQSEPATVEGLVRNYAAPLAAIPAICRFIGFSLLGFSVPFFGAVRIGIVRSFVGAVVSWVLVLVGAWIAAIVIEKLAPTFKSQGSTAQALKLVVCSMTPVWVAGVLNLVPWLSVLTVIAALYSVYLFYLGLPIIMGTPSDKVIPYMLVSAFVIIVVSSILSAITGSVAGIGSYRSL